ncbi:hypothetical protein HZ996_00595 [Cryomorphaceae bacterium]|nr:hypothetical protein HZ996_00595 [Cryomorphaceae bacterium]
MDYLNKTCFLALLCGAFLISCTESVTPPSVDESTSEKQRLLSQWWVYDSIVVDGESFFNADTVMNPGRSLSSGIGGHRSELFRRQFRYLEDQMYQLRWQNRGNYALGAHLEPNDQPNSGYWRLNAAEDTIIHNEFTWTETRYAFEVSHDQLIRRHIRYMSLPSNEYGNTISADWEAGEYVLFEEYFSRKE